VPAIVRVLCLYFMHALPQVLLLCTCITSPVLQLACVLCVHAFVFVAIPLTTNNPFGSNPTLLVFYLLWCAYFALGALQLYYGYSTSPPRFSLLHSGFNEPVPTILTVYLAIPFLHELRMVRVFKARLCV
jgi:hypothetical protein